MAKRYKCPYCELRDERKKLIAHIDKRHEEMLPEGYDGARTVYDMINHTNGHGTCRICKKDTQWNMSSQRYDVLCGNPKCKEAMREEYKKNMIRVKGTYNILNDPEQQQKMLANRKISGKYKYSDGTMFTYTGSYEKKLLEFEDAVMNIPSKDIMMPGPTIEYMYNGKKHFYIADQLYIPYNLIIEIKDGGDNKNGKETPGMIASREKTIEKEKVITDKGEYNYLRLTNNDFVQLIEIFMELKDHYLTGDDSKIVRVHEAYAKNENDIYYNKDKFDSGEINLCFITGHSGSGKSTMGRDLQSDSIEHYELDDLQCIKDHFTMENLKEYGDLIYSYFSGKGKKFYLTKKEIVDNKIPGSKYEDILYKDFVHYAMNYAKSHKNKKYIIEGVWLLCSGEDGKYWFDPEEFKDYAFYIKGTSMIISKHRAALRDAKTDNDNKIGVTKAYLNNFIRKNWKWYFIDEKRINRFRKYFKELDTVINESTINNKIDYLRSSNNDFAQLIEIFMEPKENYINGNGSKVVRIHEGTKSVIDSNYKPNGKKDLSSFKKVHITESVINKYKKEYPFLRHVRCKDTKEYICDGYIWFDNDELVAMVGSCEYTDDKTKWVVSLEITKKYRGYGLSKQILDYAVKTMNCKYLSVNKNNAVAKKIYDEYGFKVYQEDKTMYYMTIDKNIKESLYSSSSDSESSIIESKSLEFKELLKTINTPKELSNWMKTNIHYKEYDRLMTANEVFDKKKGSCHDQVNFEVEFFKKFNLKYGKEFLIEYNEGETSGGRTHSFIWFTTKGKYYWFENAWNDEQGIHGPYDSIIDIKKEVKEKMLKGSRFNNIEFSSVKNIKPGMTLDEFVTACLESTIMESMKNNNKLYFLSTINMNDDRLTPRIPSNYFTKNNYEENKTPRVCFAKTIDGCLMGLSKNLTDKEFYVHVPDPDGYYNVYNPTIKEVPDCKITGEVWIKKPVDLKCIGKIKVLKDTGEAGIPFKYGDKTAELYKWDWKWVDKYDDESINESLEIRLTTNIFEKEITIYHGSPFKTSVIYPLSFNAGTKLSKPRMSSFWADEHTAKLFGIYRLIQNNDFIISFTPDLNGLLVKPSDYNNIIKLLKSENIYLYEKTLDKKYVGIGHSNYFDEYTVDYPVRPDKIYVLGYNDLKAEINSINTYNTNDNEKIYKITEKNLNIMLKMNNGIMRKIIANDFQYFKNKSKEYKKGQLVTANNESFIDPKVVEIANYINENFIFNEDYFNVKMEPINNNTYLIAEYIIGKNSLDMKKLSDSFSMLKERCNTDQYGLCMIKDLNNNKYNLYLTDISVFKESCINESYSLYSNYMIIDELDHRRVEKINPSSIVNNNRKPDHVNKKKEVHGYGSFKDMLDVEKDKLDNKTESAISTNNLFDFDLL